MNRIGIDSRSDAQSYFLAMSQFSFIFSLVLTQNVIGYTKGLSVKLQGPYTDVARAYSEIEVVKAALGRCRSKVDSFHAQIYNRAVIIAKNVDVQEVMPRLASRQQHRQNIQAQTCIDIIITLTLQFHY